VPLVFKGNGNGRGGGEGGGGGGGGGGGATGGFNARLWLCLSIALASVARGEWRGQILNEG